MDCIIEVSEEYIELFTTEDQIVTMEHLKLSVAAGEDGITTEMIVHFEEKT